MTHETDDEGRDSDISREVIRGLRKVGISARTVCQCYKGDFDIKKKFENSVDL